MSAAPVLVDGFGWRGAPVGRMLRANQAARMRSLAGRAGGADQASQKGRQLGITYQVLPRDCTNRRTLRSLDCQKSRGGRPDSTRPGRTNPRLSRVWLSKDDRAAEVLRKPKAPATRIATKAPISLHGACPTGQRNLIGHCDCHLAEISQRPRGPRPTCTQPCENPHRCHDSLVESLGEMMKGFVQGADRRAHPPPKTRLVPRICAGQSQWQQYRASIPRSRTAYPGRSLLSRSQ
jgi:hypothetical protein